MLEHIGNGIQGDKYTKTDESLARRRSLVLGVPNLLVELIIDPTPEDDAYDSV